MNEDIQIEEAAPWLLTLIIFFGGGLRVLLLPIKGMWLDETISVWLASHNIGDMLNWIVKIDQHPPLYYLMLHFWIGRYGDLPYNVRMLSVLFGTATIPVVYLIGKRMSGVVMGLAAAVFFALSPFNLYLAQETRMYTCLTFNAAVAIYALTRLFSDPRAIRPIGSQFREYLHIWRTAGPIEPDVKEDLFYKDTSRNRAGWRSWFARHRWLPVRSVETDLAWVVFILFSAAALLTHNTAALFFFATNIFVLGLIVFRRIKKSSAQSNLKPPSLGNWLIAQISILLLWSPWISAFIQQVETVSERFWIPAPTWDTIAQMLKTFLNMSVPIPSRLSILVWGLYILVLFLGLVNFRKRFYQFTFLGTLFAVPFLGELIVSIRRPIFYDRTLIWITIPLFLVLAAGIAQLKNRFLIILVVGTLATINLFSVIDYFRFFQKEDWFTAAGYVANFAEEGDLVLFNSNFVEIPFNYYFETYEDLYSIQVEKRGVPADLFEDGIPEPAMTDDNVPKLISLIDGHDRVWLVYSHNWYTDPFGLIPQTLSTNMDLVRQRDFYGGQVQLYVTP